MSPWLTLSLQWLSGPVGLLLGFVALRLARDPGTGVPVRRAGWLLLGLTFVMVKTVDLAQGSAAIVAVWAGAGSTIYEHYIRWAPAMNHSRTGAEIVFGCLLLVVAVRGAGGKRFRQAAVALLAAGLTAGAAVGALEGSLYAPRHYSSVALWNAMELSVLGLALLVALVRASMDWMLWLIVSVRMLSQAFNVAWLSAMAWSDAEGAWSPEPWMVQMQNLVLMSLMAGLAIWRFALVRRGTAVPALLQLGRPLRFKSAVLP